ncbi:MULTISPECIES: response regulator [unclassified Flavobacterium]|jgi:CheY-like chemotaxis protein|uniref:response regulator n=1 Tax=unclassified Flavobacterium TaxID=196869 RepID=UPI00131AE7B7|nr:MULTISPECIES: response regulator [unclassified Flavobacterium]
MTNKIIWIVDDDPIYQIIASKIIHRSGMFSVIKTFKNGREAFDVLVEVIYKKEALPDIILLDINMPIMDGWEFVEELTNIQQLITKEISIYIVSSSIAIEDKTKSKNFKAILGYISKPVTVDDIILIASKE